MNTGTRRFILRLAVGLLTFLLGVAAVWALSGLNPFQSSPGTRYYRYQRYGQFQSRRALLSADKLEGASIDEPLYLKGPHGCRMKMEFGELPPPPPVAPAPPIAR